MMKKILFLFMINCFLMQVSIAQNEAVLYKNYFKQGEAFYYKQNYLIALDRFDLALGFAQTDAEKNAVNEKLNQCREKIKAQKSEIDKNLDSLKKSKAETDNLLEITKKQKEDVTKEANRADSAIKANVLNFYAFNSKDFALKSRQFTSNKDNEALYSIYSYKMIKFGNSKYGMYGKIKPDNTVIESLIQTYLNNFGIIADSSAAYAINTYKDNVLLCFKEAGSSKIRLSKISVIDSTQKTKFTDYQSYMLPAYNMVTGSVFISDNQFVITTNKGDVFMNNEDKLEMLYNCGARINDVKFDDESYSLVLATNDNKIIKYYISLGIDSIVQLTDSVYNLNIINSSVIIYNSMHKLHVISNMDISSDKIIFESQGNYITKTEYNKQNSLLYVGIDNRIYILAFQGSSDYNAYSKEILNAEHKGNINYLFYDKHTNKLISSDWTGKIMSWDFSDTKENRIYTQPIVMETNKKNYAFSFNEMLNSLFFTDQKNTGCISYNINLQYNALVKKFKDPKMLSNDWKNNTKGDIKLPEEKNDN